jgi:LPXTG-motif cell wall-anchored protein
MSVQSKVAGVLVGSGVLLLTCGALTSRVEANDFEGECTTTSPATCVLDEPEGNDPATHGTITVVRVGSVFTFTPTLNAGVTLAAGADPIQLCMVADTGQANPYVPTSANTCAGIHGDPTKFQAFPVVYDAAALLATADAPAWFALHVNLQDGDARTTYVIGNVIVGGGTTTTTGATTTTALATTTTALATTTTTQATTTTTQPATTTTTAATTTTSQPATTTTTAAATTTTAAVGATTITSPRATTTTLAAQVLGVVFQAPVADPVVVELPRTGTSARTLLLGGALLLCAGVWLLLLSMRRTPRGAHR